MNQGAKVMLGLLAFGGIAALVFASGEKKANAASAPPILPPLVPQSPGLPPLHPTDGVIVVPPLPEVPVQPGQQEPAPSAPAPVVAPTPPPIATFPSFPTPAPAPAPTGVVPGSPTTTTITIPGVGTFDPATGNVFGPNGIIVGKFNPLTGQITDTNGNVIPVPGFGQSGAPVPAAPPPIAPSLPLPSLPSSPVPTATVPAVPPGTITLPTTVITATGPEAPGTAPADTVAVVTTMLDQEHLPHWRIAAPGLHEWQAARKLTPDGNFGPGTALAMAAEMGTVPIVRAWPKGSFLGSPHLPAYQTALRKLALSAPEPRKSQLLAAANREQGQGFGTPEKPIVTTITLHEV